MGMTYEESRPDTGLEKENAEADMKIHGAVIKEQGVTFAIVIVKAEVLNNRVAAQASIASFSVLFPGMPLIVMAQDSRGVPTYFGRQDIVRFLAKVPIRTIPWREYTVT